MITRLFSNLILFLAGFSFLTFRGKDLFLFQYIYPLVFSAIYLSFYFEWAGPYPIFNVDLSGLVTTLQSHSSSLIGFFIAALAAVVAFDGNSLDAAIDGEGVTHRRSGVFVKATRRELLAALFGYCIILCVLAILLPAIFTLLFSQFTLDPMLNDILQRTVAPALLVLGASSMLSAGLLGLYYLIRHFEK